MSLSLRRPRIQIDTLAREAPKALLVDERRARPLWFDGQFLTASTFNREQTYVLTRQSDLALATGAGVIEGLQVERDGGSQTALLIRRGQGLAGNGEPLVVHEDLRIDLADIPLQRMLDRAIGLAAEPGPPPQTRSGLFVLALAALEFTSNPIGSYPTHLDGERGLEDSLINEAVLVTLVPFALRGTLLTPGMRRAQAAESIFVGGGEPDLPAGVLPLAALELAGNTITWLDPELVRREAAVGHSDVLGLGIAPEPRRAAHVRQYHAMLDGIVEANPAGFAASEHFLALPPVGRLPAACVGFTEQPGSTTPVLTQGFLPSAMPAMLSLIPEDELPALVEEALLLPPIPLGADEAVLAATPVTVFAPVARAAFEETLRQLRGGERVLPPRVNLGLAPLRPMDLLEALVTPARRPPEPAVSTLSAEGWRTLLEGRRWLWYARGRQIAPRDELFGVTSPFRLPSELPKEPEGPQEPEQPEEPEAPDGADRNELERDVRLWASGVGEEARLLELRERSNDIGRERVHAMLGDLIKRGDDLLARGAMLELHQLEKINGTTIGPVQRRFAVPELGQGLARITPQLLSAGPAQPGFQVRLLTAGDQTVEVIKIIREMTGLGLREAKAIVDSVPSDVPVGAMDATTLRGFLARLSALGAQTDVLRGGADRALSAAEVERRSQLLVASMALPELDEIGRKANEDVLVQVIAKLVDVIAGSIKPDALREAILDLLRGALG
jgi:ribosomal protein L7/L12